MAQVKRQRFLYLLCLVPLIISFYLGLSFQKNKDVEIMGQVKSSPASDCGAWCWIDGIHSKVGYGTIQGFYTTYQSRDKNSNILTCPALIVNYPKHGNSNPTFDNLVADKPEENILSLGDPGLEKVHPRFRQLILNSTKDHPVNVGVFQENAPGHGYNGCGFADYFISGVSKAN